MFFHFIKINMIKLTLYNASLSSYSHVDMSWLSNSRKNSKYNINAKYTLLHIKRIYRLDQRRRNPWAISSSRSLYWVTLLSSSELKIVGMTLEVTTHRLVFRSNSNHCLLIKGENIQEVSITVTKKLCRKVAFSARNILSSYEQSLEKWNCPLRGTTRPRSQSKLWSASRHGW